MPFKMHKIIFFPEKKYGSLPTQNFQTLNPKLIFFLFGLIHIAENEFYF